jgi:hypothetical protein
MICLDVISQHGKEMWNAENAMMGEDERERKKSDAGLELKVMTVLASSFVLDLRDERSFLLISEFRTRDVT